MAFSFGNASQTASSSGQAQTGPDLLDIQTEALGFLAIAGEAKLQLLPSPWPAANLPPSTSSLMSVAPKRGLVAAAGPDCVILATTESIRKAYEGPRIGESHTRPFQAQLTLPMPMRLSQVTFTADETYLILSAEVGGGLAVYEVQNLMNGSQTSSFEMSTNSAPLRAAVPNPTPEKGELLAIVTMDGKLMVANLKERNFISGATGQILKEGVSCISWSAKGKQLVAGLIDGSAFQMTPEGVAKAQIPRPPDVDPGYHVSSITWLENDVFMMVHNPSNIDSNNAPTSLFHLVTRLPKSTEHIFQKLADPAPNFGLNRSPPYHFLLRLRDFPPNLRDLIIVSSTASTDIGLFTRSAVPLVSDKPADKVTDVFTMTEMSDDSRRAQLPVNEAMEDTSPIGAILDLSSRESVPRPIPSDEMDESRTPLPALLVLNNEGVLASWWVVYSESVRQGTSYPGLVAAAASQPGGAMQPLSSGQNVPSVPAFNQTFGSPSNVGSAFGTTNKPASSFGSGATFGGQPNKPSGWPNASSGPVATTGAAFGAPSFGTPATPAFSGPKFGTPTFGNAASPAAGGVAFGNSALPGSRPSPWSAAGSGAPATTFGQPSGLGVAGTPGLGNAKPSGSVFGSGASSVTSATGGFASFASNGGFAAVGTSQKEQGNIFATKSDSTSFSLSPKTADSTSSFGYNGGSAAAPLGSAFGSQGFTLGSTFKPDSSRKDDSQGTEKAGSGSFFGGGFGKALGEAQASPIISSPEATMDDTTDLGQEPTVVPKDTVTEPISTTEQGRGQLLGTGSAIAAPKFQFPTAQPKAIGLGELAPKSTNDTAPSSQIPSSTGFSFGTPVGTTESKDTTRHTKESAPVSASIQSASQDADRKPRLQSSDNISPNIPARAERPSVIAPQESQQIGDAHAPAKGQLDAPLPPDFINVSKPPATQTLNVDKPQQSKSLSFQADLPPPLHVPFSPGEGPSSDYSDVGDQSYSDDGEKSGEDSANEITDAGGNTPGLTPEGSFDRPNYTNRGNAPFATGPLGGHQPPSRSLFGEIGNRITPVLAPPKPGSPRSPSPIRSSVPTRLLGRPDASRSVSAPIAASKLLGAHAAPISSNAFGNAGEFGEEEARRRTEASKKKEAEESQALVDIEDDRMQDFLSRDVEGTTRLDEFVAHQDYVGGADKDSIPFQVEAVYRDINSMIDTLGVNSHTVKSFTKGHTEHYKDAGRERADLEGDETWCLGEIENLSSIIEKDLSKELQQGCIKDVENKLQLCSNFVKELVKLRTRTEDALIVITSSRDQDHSNINKSQPLTAEQIAQQHDLRKDLANFQKLLGDAEEELILLRANISSFTGSGGKSGPGPTTEAVMRTIVKMTAMAEKRSGDVDVIENQMRRLRFSSVTSNDRNSPEGSPFASPTKPAKRHTTAFTKSARPFTPDGTQRGPRALHMSLSSSTRSQNQSTPPRKKLQGFTEEDKSTIKCSFSNKKEVTDRLKVALERSKTRDMDPYPPWQNVLSENQLAGHSSPADETTRPQALGSNSNSTGGPSHSPVAAVLPETRDKVGSLERLLGKGAQQTASGTTLPHIKSNPADIKGEDLPQAEDEKDLEPTPLAVVDAVYEDDADDDLLDLGIQIGRMRITERIGGFFRPRLAQELEYSLYDTAEKAALSPDNTSTTPSDVQTYQYLLPSPAYIAPASGFVFGHTDNGSSLIDYLPSRLAADRLVKQYFTVVHPVAQLLHYPSFEKEYESFWEDISLGIEPPTSVQAIVFAAMFSGVVSMSEMIILRDFGVPKDRLIDNFKSGTETALSKSHFLRTTKVETLQAFVMYLIPLCRAETSRAHSVLVGAAIRMAECMGLHRDGETYGLNPIETQVRRLIWYQLCFLDIRTCEAQGPRPSIRKGDFDTRLPINVNDVDLHANGKPVAGVDRWTDATFTMMRFEINEMMRLIWSERPRIESRKSTLTNLLGKIEAFRRHLAEKYDHLVDERVPFQRFAKMVKTLLLGRLTVMVLHPYHNSVQSMMPPRLRQMLIAAATNTVENAMWIDSVPDVRPWAWYAGAFNQYHSAFLLLLDCHFFSHGENLDRIWHCLDYVFETDPSEPREVRSRKVLCELQEKTAVYQQFRKMRASPAMLKHVGQRPPRRVDRNINSGASSISAQHGNVASTEPSLIGKVAVPDVVFAGVSNGEALWALPNYGSPEGSSDSGGAPGQANPVQMQNTKMEGYSVPEIDWVSPTCTEAELKKAYKVGALKHHPDKNAHNPDAADKFKDLSHAYEILSDPQKRQIYDQYGEEGLEGGGAGGGMNAEDLFSQFFGGGSVFGGGGGMFGGGMGQRGPPKARTIHHVHKVSLEDIYRGKVSKLALQKSVICSKCDGRGGKEGAVKKCTGCDGHGMKTMMRQMGPMIQRFQTVCPDCNGEGEIIREKDKCKQCNGKKTVVERKVLHVHVDRGVKSGHKIEFRGEGDQTPGVQPGDVVFEIEQKPHARFQRKEDDIFYSAEIDLVTALAGGNIFVEHLDERWLSVDILPGEVINPGSVKMVRGQGMPSHRHHDFGNLYIQFDVKFPEKNWTTNPAEFDALKAILPPTVQPVLPPAETMTEAVDLEDVDASQQARAAGHGMMDDDDEDGHPAGAERVQCASQ
ncbi:hypothetical protein V502_02392 [Pseudogymnoascus sp. VKM F-4520 (FW-2644)]|nr:hypothetical protein V502_02392 [Pseudogymnoascus sp. VKM F-4520 (FW-2644)]